MTDTELIDHLRCFWKVECRHCHHMNSDMTSVHAAMRAAADRLAELVAENERLRADLAVVIASGDEMIDRRETALAVVWVLADRLAAVVAVGVHGDLSDFMQDGVEALAAYDEARRP